MEDIKVFTINYFQTGLCINEISKLNDAEFMAFSKDFGYNYSLKSFEDSLNKGYFPINDYIIRFIKTHH